MNVVADSGPLIALAKIGGLETLFDVYPRTMTSRAVFEETVSEGEYVRAPDAALLRAEYQTGRLHIEPLRDPLPSDNHFLGQGERESIHLALRQDAEWLLVDDLEARQTAIQVFAASEARARVKGTLGVITTGFIEGSTSLDRALQLLEAIHSRKDVWISAELCQQVASTLRRTANAPDSSYS